MRTVKAVVVAASLGVSALAIQAADAGWFGFGPFHMGYGPRPLPVAAYVPPPYLWGYGYGYGYAPYGVVPPVGPGPYAVPPQAPADAGKATSPSQTPAAEPAKPAEAQKS